MKILIKETTREDLQNVMNLWNAGEVMFYVGFPNGLNVNIEQMENWLKTVNKDIFRKHYSIYEEELGFCGETFYSVDKNNDLAALDIKLFPYAQGRGIARYALSYAISEVFTKDLASRAYVEPNPKNEKALKLYERLGFISKKRPEFLEEYETYLEITKESLKE
ncbi:GNAT family N-acetyltransferase [Desnuesiella massiliensis]|uniref:GNAT family N-acetyltransferase n=1 Tax=Desnuesiella massiliensis TaxID=1650662 RepID=UPI0006E292A7|nr:GNAT family protein [Desnuesiella massiliensis]